MSEEECRKVAVECQGDREMIFEDGEILSEILSLATLGETLNH